jgi:hypothetical protein
MGEVGMSLQKQEEIVEVNYINVELRVFSTDNGPVSGLFALPDGDLQTVELKGSASGFSLKSDPSPGKVKWQINRAAAK